MMLADAFQDDACCENQSVPTTPRIFCFEQVAVLVVSVMVGARVRPALSCFVVVYEAPADSNGAWSGVCVNGSRHASANSMTDRVAPILSATCPRAYSNPEAASGKQP